MPLKISDKDRIIISMFQSNPDISQAIVSKRLGLSQPSISARLKKMKKSGVLAFQAGINLRKANLYIAKVDLTVKSDCNLLVETFSKCPYCINGFITTGKHNILFFFVSENMNTLEAIVNNRLRPLPEVTDVEFSIILAPTKDFIVPLFPSFEMPSKSPCGASCNNCNMYATNRCLGCPLTEAYKGSLLKRPKR